MRDTHDILLEFARQVKKYLELSLLRLFCMVLMHEAIIGRTRTWML